VIAALSQCFPDLATAIQRADREGTVLKAGLKNTVTLHLTISQDILKIVLSGDLGYLAPSVNQQARKCAALMQDIREFSPQLVWREDADGKRCWANAAYDSFASGTGPQPFAGFSRDMQAEAQKQQRVACANDETRWFDVTTVASQGGLLHFASEATALVRADEDRRSFVQTLGKTFADLSIGLAIFDKSRQLAMFNPALLDMTKLPVTFLSGRPSIDTFLDRLRELRIMPEPKDYTTWREQFTAMEVAAKNGTYSENWTLPDGQTFRVTGRPHPNGAFAILFEDITAEVSLTRRFRSDIETSQAVLDTLPDAIAVFSGSGTMVISNRAYAKLWATDAAILLDHRDVRTEITVWQDHCIASPMWTEMRDFIQRLGSRKPWSENAMLIDGRHLRCHAIPIAGGMTMVRFAIAPPMRPVIQKLTQIDPAILVRKA
jgi:PAS domain-containing protein